MAKQSRLDQRRRWHETIERQRASGQSIVGFCAKEKLSPASFHAWKRRLPQRRSTEQNAALVPVQIVDGAQDGTGKLEVRWRDGIVLQAQGCEAETVAAVVAAISAAPARRARQC